MKPRSSSRKTRLASCVAVASLLSCNLPLLAQTPPFSKNDSPNNNTVGTQSSVPPLNNSTQPDNSAPTANPIPQVVPPATSGQSANPIPQAVAPIPLPKIQAVAGSAANQPNTAVGQGIDDAALDNLDASHDKNSVLSMDQLRLDSALTSEQFKPIRLEVSYDQMITLREALHYALDNNLAIKVSRDNLNYQHYVLYGQFANALPNLSMAYNLTHTDIMNEKVGSLAKVFLTRVTYPVFQGGSVAYGILGQFYREKGWRQAYYASIHDEILDLYQKYNNLVLARALLQIRGKAVEVSKEQLKVNKAMLKSGTGTKFSVLQADAQLSSDEQALLQQQVAVRQAALALNYSMNAPMAVNLVPAEDTIREEAIFQDNSGIDELVEMALKHRPELREYEDYKVAAGRNVQVAAAPLYPQASFFTQYSYTKTTTNGATGDTSGAGVFGGLYSTYQQGFALVYSLSNFGLTSVANLFAAGSLDRQARIQANQELQTVMQSVRSDFLAWRAAREQIDNAAHSVRASQEELRLARLRLGVEVTTELEVIQAQRDYINSLTSQAQAIVSSNLAQAQLLHDIGMISEDTILNGYKRKP